MKKYVLMVFLTVAAMATMSAKPPKEQAAQQPAEEQEEVVYPQFVRQEDGDIYEMLGDSILRIYRCVFDSEKDRLSKLNPADKVYGGKWVNKWVNPYKVDPALMQDTFMVDTRNASMPLDKLRITSVYGWRGSRMHYGQDFGLTVGDPVRSVWDGKVRVVDYDEGGYGNFIVVRHANGIETVYGHLSKQLVTPNQVVKAGEAIGLGGNTGRSSGPHLHFETRYMGNAFDATDIFDFTNRKTKMDDYPLCRNSYKKAIEARAAKAATSSKSSTSATTTTTVSTTTDEVPSKGEVKTDMVITSKPSEPKPTTAKTTTTTTTTTTTAKPTTATSSSAKPSTSTSASAKPATTTTTTPVKSSTSTASSKTAQTNTSTKSTATTSTKPTSSSTHTVKQGDSMYSIAKNNGLTVEELKKLNNMTDTTIKPGQVLKTK